MDGVRIFSEDVCDLIQKVPSKYPFLDGFSPFFHLSLLKRPIGGLLIAVFLASTLSIFRPGSTLPAAILYDAWESFASKSPKADESIRSIRPELAKAVDECIDAAGQEWEPYWQRRLLNVRPCFRDMHLILC
jgi:hypothetical protein